MQHSSEVQGQDCITPRRSTPVVLQYPTIPVHGTPDSWLLQSQLIMASHRDDSSVCSFDDTSSSAGDNSYVYIENGSDMTTDDEDQSQMTQSTSSIEGRPSQPNDVHSSNHTLSPNDYIREHSKNQPSFHRLDSMEPSGSSDRIQSDEAALGIESEQGLDETLREAKYLEHSETAIHLKESSNSEGHLTIQAFNDSNIPQVLRQLYQDPVPQQIYASIRLKMSGKALVPDRPFKVFFVGDASAKDSVQYKIATALAVDSLSEKRKSSGSMVVPIPSFSHSTGQDVVLIEKTNIDIVVDHCNTASFVRNEGGFDTIGLALTDGTAVESSWDGSAFAIAQDWQLPDIAIFYLSEFDDTTSKQNRRFARSFMSRHNVPSIIISQATPWDKPSDAMTLDYRTPHICLEASTGGQTKSKTHKRLPIDLQSFLQIVPYQLSRNLALLAEVPMVSTTIKQRQAGPKMESPGYVPDFKACRIFLTWLFHAISDPMRVVSQRRRIHPIQPFLLASLILIIGCVISQNLRFVGISGVPNIDRDGRLAATQTVSASNLASTASVLSAKRIFEPKPHPSPSLVVPVGMPKGLVTTHTNTDLESFLLDSPANTMNKSEKFKVHVIGDCHIVLRPPYWFTRSKKMPKLYFNVTQGNRVLKHQLSTLFEGVHAIELPVNEAHGNLNITVWTTSRPRINETFQVQFRNAWFQTPTLQRAVFALTSSIQGEINIVQTRFGIFYAHSSAELTAFIRESFKKVADIGTGVKRITSATRNQPAHSKDLVLSRVRKMSHDAVTVLLNMKERTLDGLWPRVDTLAILDTAAKTDTEKGPKAMVESGWATKAATSERSERKAEEEDE
ncbi:MAG: hypothetical protein LQ351_003200 [Letrouitia transgressa]|nr:MAG: hypothetical protein LQ351_003200 [Letrouitia transgressa]